MADAALAGERTGPLLEWRTRLFGGFAERLAAEGERRLLWLPVFFGAGIGVYFLLKVEPPLWPGAAAAIVGAGAAWTLRRYPAWCELALAFAAFSAGFALMRETAGSARRRCCSAASGRSPSPEGWPTSIWWRGAGASSSTPIPCRG
jgi:hypothetical protein